MFRFLMFIRRLKKNICKRMIYKNNLGFTEAVKIFLDLSSMTICMENDHFSIFIANFKILTVNFKI